MKYSIFHRTKAKAFSLSPLFLKIFKIKMIEFHPLQIFFFTWIKLILTSRCAQYGCLWTCMHCICLHGFMTWKSQLVHHIKHHSLRARFGLFQGQSWYCWYFYVHVLASLDFISYGFVLNIVHEVGILALKHIIPMPRRGAMVFNSRRKGYKVNKSPVL